MRLTSVASSIGVAMATPIHTKMMAETRRMTVIVANDS